MKYYMIAGEASGDLHGSNLMKAIKARDPQAEFRCWGGDLMQKEGGTLVKHISELAFMGFIEVLANLPTILRNMRFCKKDILSYLPDAVIFVDYPGFNLPIASFVHKNKITTIYYISPQVWAWKKGRIKKIKRIIDQMFVILPFEKSFYEKEGVNVHFFGHPLLDAIDSYRNDFIPKENLPVLDANRKCIALLPGSRVQEIKKNLPVMLSIVSSYPEYQFVLAAMSAHPESLYQAYIGDLPVKLVWDSTYPLLSKAHAALVTSGTATLETALFSVPQVVCYKANALSVWIAKRLIKSISFISLVNLIMEREIVKELIQEDLNEARLKKEFLLITEDKENRGQIETEYASLKEKLGSSGASERIGEAVYLFLQRRSLS